MEMLVPLAGFDGS